MRQQSRIVKVGGNKGVCFVKERHYPRLGDFFGECFVRYLKFNDDCESEEISAVDMISAISVQK